MPKLERSATRDEPDRAVLGLALYALSSCFLATALVFTKKLGARSQMVFLRLCRRPCQHTSAATTKSCAAAVREASAMPQRPHQRACTAFCTQAAAAALDA